MLTSSHSLTRYGIFTNAMANVYVRNSRFEASSSADISLTASAGNSVRRCVSVGSASFVVRKNESLGVIRMSHLDESLE